MKASDTPRQAHPSLLTLLAALSALVTLALAGELILVFVQRSQQGQNPPTLANGDHITTAQTASGIRQDNSPIDSITSFRVGQTVYIAYTVTDAGPGNATIKLYNNGILIDTMSQQFPQRSSYNAYFSFQATQTGNWQADLYWQNQGETGQGSLEQRVTFLVGSASALPVNHTIAAVAKA